MSDIRLRLEGFNGDKVVLGIKGDSKYAGRNLFLTPKDFVEFLKLNKSSKGWEFLIELSDDASIEAYKKLLL